MTTHPRTSGRTRLIALIVSLILIAVGGIFAWRAFWHGQGPDDRAAHAAESVLPAETSMGVVELRVADLDTMTEFYTTGVGLAVIGRPDDDTVSLGSTGGELIRLVRTNDEASSFTDAGLYHSAILYPDAAGLAEALLQTATYAPELFQGSADHRVSLAFYFADPEGNGLELYVDRPAEEWVWQDGRVTMGSEPLDPNDFIAENLDPEATSDAPSMGHVHLRVGDLGLAREFYVDILGFAVTSESEGALFMAAGGYHHHLAANTWSSAGAGQRPPGLGLGHVTVRVPGEADLLAVSERLEDAGLAYELSDTALTTLDPWGTVVHIRLL